MMTPVVAIDAAECRDAGLVGGKAARLAQARAAGLPVPDSIALPCAASAATLAVAARGVADRGRHACRLEVMSADRSALADVAKPARRLGPALAVRSSAPLEDDTRLAGAYTSLIGVSPGEVPTAILSVWASAIRAPGPPPLMGVLIQPDLRPVWAGTARRGDDGSVEVVAVKGGAAPLTAGWATGVTITVSPAGDIGPTSAATEADPSVARAAAALARDVAAALGDDLIEWAYSGGRAWLLQSGRLERPPPPPCAAASGAELSPVLSCDPRILLRAARCAGDLGERWILPWAIAWEAVPSAGQDGGPGLMARPAAAWNELTRLSARLTAQVWGVRPSEAGRVAADLESLRGGGPPDERLTALAAPDPGLARRCMLLCARLAAHLLASGVIASASEFWALPADLGPVVRGEAAVADPFRRAHQAALRWEPLLYAAAAAGPRYRGVAAAPGMGCGPAIRAGHAVSLAERRAAGVPARSVIVASYPLPRYAPLLMGAAALVAHGGSGAAHLVTVARTLGVPTVLGCDLSAAIRASDGAYIAVDGGAGTVSVIGAVR
jgi:phosphohistidine swiveling domain-containing protein